jgi:hypothetical protein
MRKATIAMLLLLVISIGGVCVAAAGVHAPHDQVELKENVIYGDSAAANGLEIQTHVTWDNHLFWDTTLWLAQKTAWKRIFDFPQSERVERFRQSIWVSCWKIWSISTTIR